MKSISFGLQVCAGTALASAGLNPPDQRVLLVIAGVALILVALISFTRR